MRRLALAGLLALLVAVVFAPTAVAQMDDSMMSSASASASAMSSASAMGDQMKSGKGEKMMMSASASPLPRTGGVPLMPLLSAAALALMAGSGILATRLARRSS
jgi:hypothetical protein